MKRKCSFLFLFLLISIACPSTNWAGGVVQEFKVSTDAKVGQSTHAMTAQSKPYHELASKEKPANTSPIEKPPCTFKVRYDNIAKAMVLLWKPMNHKGLPAIKYHIYRWTLHHTKAQLLASVDGDIYRYIDTDLNVDETYFYKVIGIFRSSNTDSLYVSFQYPVQQLRPSEGGKGIHVPAPQDSQPNQPPAGLGCSLHTGSTPAPLGGLLLLLLLFLLPILRRPQHLS